jgi:putative SOS response-associated peptidase YedK
LARYFDVDDVVDRSLEASWNVAPTDERFVVVDKRGSRTLDAYRWGLVPYWATDPKIGSRFINARAETLASSNAFRHALVRRRCIVPADGFYEWKKTPGSKTRQAFFIHRPDGEPYAFAGLWERWRPQGTDTERPKLYTFTIITAAANQAVASVHDRMPAILPPEAWERWLDPAVGDIDRLTGLLAPAPTEWTVMHPVGPAVNSPRNQGPELAMAVDPDAPGGQDGKPAGPVQGTLL